MQNHSITDYIQKWGCATSIGLYDPRYKMFTVSSVEGFIGYQETAKCAVVFGDPVCPPENIPTLTNAFHEQCNAQGKSIVYVSISEPFLTWLQSKQHCSLIEMGQELILNPSENILTRGGHHPSALRNKCNQAQKEGMVIKEYTGNDPQLELELNKIGKTWVENREGPQIHFGLTDFFANRSNKRWFYAEKNNEICGLLILNRLDAHKGWVQNLSIVTSNAPKYTSEVLLLGSFELLRKEECQFYSIGLMPVDDLGRIEGLGKFRPWLARKIYKIAKKIFKLDERKRFWKKFNPQKQSTYLAFVNSRVGINEIKGILNAFNTKISNKSSEN